MDSIKRFDNYGVRQSFLVLKYLFIFLDNLHIMDGSYTEDQRLKKQLVSKGILIPLKYDNCYLARTDPNVSQFLLFQHLNEYRFR